MTFQELFAAVHELMPEAVWGQSPTTGELTIDTGLVLVGGDNVPLVSVSEL